MGAEVVLHGDSYAEAQSRVRRRSQHETGAALIHPFDDPLVIAGQGTIGDEILRHEPPQPRRGVRRRSAAAG